jgi:hypothetical protein
MSQSLVTSPGRSDGVSAAGNVFRLRNDNFHFFRESTISSSILSSQFGWLPASLFGQHGSSLRAERDNLRLVPMRQAKRTFQSISPIQAAEHFSCLRSLICGPGHSCLRRAFVTVDVEYRFGGQRRDWIGQERGLFRDQVFPVGAGAANAGIGSQV